MRRLEPEMSLEQAANFFAAVHNELKEMLTAKGFILGTFEFAKRSQGQFVEIPGARWYVLKGRAGHRDSGWITAFEKEFAAYIGGDTNREDVLNMAAELSSDIEGHYHASKGAVSV